jgi:hypothetical protein
MKKYFATVAACLALIATAAIGEDAPWIDIQNCDFCKVITAEKGLMEHMMNEYHNVATGVVVVTHVDKEYQEAFGRAMAGCKKLAEAMQKGEKHNVCQYCSTLGGFLQAGAKQDEFMSHGMAMTVYSSTDAAMVAKMHAWASKTNEVMKQMAGASH